MEEHRKLEDALMIGQAWRKAYENQRNANELLHKELSRLKRELDEAKLVINELTRLSGEGGR